MAGNIPDYLIGRQGVNIVASPLHTPDGGLLTAKNVEFIREFGVGGIGTRLGIAKLPGSVQLAGDVNAIINAPFPLYTEVDLMVGLNTGETPTWKKSTDGASFTDLTSAVVERCAGIDQFPTNASAVFFGQRTAAFGNQFYFPGNDYTVNTSAPPVINFNGVLYHEQFRIPNNPAATGVCRGILDMLVVNGVMYMAVSDPGGSAPNQKGRVLAYDPANGTLTLIGNAFGQDTGENSGGYPFCLASYLGNLFVGTYGVSGNNQGKVYRILPGIETTWTLDHTATLHNGYIMSMAAYNGDLYVGTDADSSGTAIIEKRTSAGAYSTSLSAPQNNLSYFGGLIVFNNELYAGWTDGGATKSYIKKYDGSSWVTDKDVGVDYAVKVPGVPFIFRGELYWPFLGSPSSATNLTGFLLKRTTGGVWSRPLNGFGIRGGLNQYIPEP